MVPVAVVICGASSSGKTSLARTLQELLLPEIWLTFSVDDIIYSLPESVLHRCNHENNWEGVDGKALFEGATGSLRALLQSGNKVIFDVVVSHSKDASRVQTSLSGFHSFTVELRCDLAILEHRASFRGDRTLEETRRSFESAPAQLASDLILDSGAHSPKELASSVVTALSNIQEIQE